MDCKHHGRPQPVDIKRIADPRGNLSVIERTTTIDFDPVRCYWLNDVPGGENRDGHAYRTSAELIVALSGSFTVETRRPGEAAQRFTLDRPDRGLLVPPLTWRTLSDFTTGATALVVASTPFDENDYIRDPQQFDSL